MNIVSSATKNYQGNGATKMTEKRFTGVEIIHSPHLPVEIFNEKTNEMEVFHMIQKGNTLFVSEELYTALDERYGDYE